MLFPNLLWFILIFVMTFFVGCSSEKKNTVQGSSTEVSKLPSEAQLGSMNLNKSRGHILFKVAPTAEQKLTAFSVEQPEAKLSPLDKDTFALTDLVPQQHTLVATLETGSTKSFAVLRDVVVEAGQFIELGIIPFEKSGQLRGRVLNASDSTPLAAAVVEIPQLSRQTQTNATGEFLFADLPHGQWKMSFNKLGHGRVSGIDVKVKSSLQTDLGDFWLGESIRSDLHAEVTNAIGGLVSEAKAILRLQLPPTARTLVVKTRSDNTLVEHGPVRSIVEVKLPETGTNELRIFVYDARNRLLGVLSAEVEFDPFASNGKRFQPGVRITERVVVSPSRTVTISLENIPTHATQVRIGLDNNLGAWTTPAAVMNIDIPKSNTSCGQRELNVQYQTAAGELSAITRVPVTLSCWKRIPHRSMVDKIVGIDNAAVWTGTHAFVWSGKQFKTTERTLYFAGNNSAENQLQLDALQEYTYLDGGYVYKPKYNSITQDLDHSEMETIVTDNAPRSRALAGVGGSGNWVAIYGGESEGTPLAEGGIFDIEKNGWFTMEGEGAPSPRIKPSVFFIAPKKVLVWGGRSKTNLGYDFPLNDGAIYDLERHIWTPINPVGAPSARLHHVGVWTGSEFVVLGGQTPGGGEVYSGGRFNPAAHSWTPTTALTSPVTFTSALHNGDDIILYGRNNLVVLFSLSQNRQIQSTQFNLGGWNVNPTLVLDGDGSGALGSYLYVFGGRATFSGTDPAGNLVRMTYRPGVVETSGNIFNDIFATGLLPTLNGKPTETCCVDMLGFRINNRVFAINGTSVTNYSVLAKIKENENTHGQKYHSTDSVPAYKASHSFVFHSDEFTLFPRATDISPEFDTHDYGPVGPYSYFWAHPPVWSPENRSLFWYGGKYRNLIAEQYQSGGFIYNVDTKTWNTFAAPNSEPNYTDPQGVVRTYSRFSPLSFFLNNRFFVLFGYRAESGLQFRNDGFSIPFLSGSAQTAEQILSSSTENFDFVQRDTSTYANKRWDPNPECIVGNSVFLSGGRRQSTKMIGGTLKDSALVEDKVIFDASTSTMQKTASDPLGLRAGTSVVSLGTRCFLWGGYSADGAKLRDNETNTVADIVSRFAAQGTGFIFFPGTDVWTPVPSSGAPSARAFMHSIWTGKDVLLWGGTESTAPRLDTQLSKNKGVFRFTPDENRWSQLSVKENEPIFSGYERPVWTGSRMLIWKTPDLESSYEFDPERNEWTRLPLPYGFGHRYNNFLDSNVVWMGDRLFVMPYGEKLLAVMAFYVPPNL